jgi:hypothetical protein
MKPATPVLSARRVATWPILAVALIACLACQTARHRDAAGIAPTTIPPDQAGYVTGTGPESQDLVAVADKMLRSIRATPAIAGSATSPRVALLPLTNNTRFPINKNIFLKLIKARLNSEAHGRVVFLARSKMDEVLAERDRKRQGLVEDDPSRRTRAPKGADFFLTGSLVTSEGVSLRGTCFEANKRFPSLADLVGQII